MASITTTPSSTTTSNASRNTKNTFLRAFILADIILSISYLCLFRWKHPHHLGTRGASQSNNDITATPIISVDCVPTLTSKTSQSSAPAEEQHHNGIASLCRGMKVQYAVDKHDESYWYDAIITEKPFRMDEKSPYFVHLLLTNPLETDIVYVRTPWQNQSHTAFYHNDNDPSWRLPISG